MNLDATMHGLYIVKARFDYLAKQLEQAGLTMAAEELKREAHHFGCQVTQLEGVLNDYTIDIAAVQLPQQSPRFIGVDRGAQGGERTCFHEVKA